MKSITKKYCFFPVIIALIISIIPGCGNTNFLKKAKKLQVEIVSDDDTGKDEKDVSYHNLFDLEPGQMVPRSSYGGAIDPVGTTIEIDLDGDGIPDKKETTTNAWVADYPVVETNISTPITMRIEILEENKYNQTSISSEIKSSDIDNTKDQSTESIHRNEVNEKTVQFQDSLNESASGSHSEGSSESSSHSTSVSVSASAGVMGIGASGSGSVSKSVSGSSSSNVADSWSGEYGATTTKWKDQPFKNNLQSDGWAVKSNSASKNSRNLRNEMRSTSETSIDVKSNAGYIRAALHIKNESVNMPVKLSNIRCSLMFEHADGFLESFKSFDLRNDDFSMFSVEIYGGETFGPYIVELNGLNTNYIKEAIANGYNPKIFITDYKMRHVEDSNYRKSLSNNFTGDNLKIIEENAKGRTAGIKFVGPGMRKFFRVTAFDSNSEESRMGFESDDAIISPGVSLEKALKRINYSGMNIEVANYVMDFTGINPEGLINKFMVKGIKSVNGIKTTVPYHTIIEEADGTDTYILKPIPEWTDEEFENFKMWAVYADGKYYFHSSDVVERDNEGNVIPDNSGKAVPKKYTYTYDGKTYPVYIIQGITSMIWPGDHYDITCLDLKEILLLEKGFGRTPLITNEKMKFNSKWKESDFGKYPYDPDVNSQYLGEAGIGDTIEFKIKLNSTKFLNPEFKRKEYTDYYLYSDFEYSLDNNAEVPVVDNKFKIREALDFEISFGIGGERGDWINLCPIINNYFPKRGDTDSYYDLYSETPDDMIEYSWNYVKQEFTIRLLIKGADDSGSGSFPGAGDDGTVNIYLRQAPTTAYRESIWPRPYHSVTNEKIYVKVPKYFANVWNDEFAHPPGALGETVFAFLPIEDWEDNEEKSDYEEYYEASSIAYSGFDVRQYYGDENPDYIIANWIGVNNVSFPTIHSFTDSSYYNRYIYNNITVVELDGKEISVITPPTDGNLIPIRPILAASPVGNLKPINPISNARNIYSQRFFSKPLVERDYEVKVKIVQ